MILILFLNSLIHIQKLDKRLNEVDGFRQTQTALGIKSFLRESLNPFTATLPIAGPGSQIPFEFPLFQMLASFSARLIPNLDSAARLTGLISFLVTTILIYCLAIRIWNFTVAVMSTLIFSFSSFSLQWGSASLIEFSATALILGSILVLINFIDNQDNKVLIFLFFIFFTLGFMVKITSSVAWLSVFLILILKNYKKINNRSKIYLASSVLATTALTAFWTNWADGVKIKQEYWAPALTSSALRSWNFGTLQMRLELDEIYEKISKIADPVVGNSSVLVALIIYSFVRIKKDPILSSLGLTILAGPVVFFPLYGHLYYSAALAPATALLASASLASFIDKKIILYFIALLIISSSYTNQLGKYYLNHYFQRPGLHDVSEHILINTQPNEVVMLRCNDDWSSEYLYYADREGLMLRYKDIIPGESEWGTKYTYLAFCNEGNIDLSIVPDSVYLEVESKLLYKIHRK